jgi:hypothetical protein
MAPCDAVRAVVERALMHAPCLAASAPFRRAPPSPKAVGKGCAKRVEAEACFGAAGGPLRSEACSEPFNPQMAGAFLGHIFLVPEKMVKIRSQSQIFFFIIKKTVLSFIP